MSDLLRQDVEKGREVLNFSEWQVNRGDQANVEAMVESISKEQMPLPYYLILHPEAELTAEQKGRLITGLIATASEGDDRLEADELDKDEE
jgi:hypothetical protein